MAGPATYAQWSMNAGEMSQRMFGRADQAVYANGLAEMVGWLPLLQGPAVAAPGTHYVGDAAGQCRLFPFEFNPTQGYAIEASGGVFRFYTNDARIETAPGVPYEVAHDYTYDELLQLDYWQSEDVLYLAGAGKPVRKLSRTSAVTFTFGDFVLRNGPIDTGNNDEASTVQVSGGTGAITITANNAIFAPGDVGRFFEIECEDFNDIPSWQPGIRDLVVGQKVTWGGRVYQLASAATYTGTNPPEHDSGTEWDGLGVGQDAGDHGPYGARWTYLYNRFGLAKITAYNNPNEVEATVQTRFADSLTGTPSWRWAFGSFSDTTGYPDTVGGWNDCLVLTMGNRVFTSVIDDFDNFARRDTAGDFQRDLSGQVVLPSPAKINWQAADRYLLLGSETAEFTVERIQIQTGTPGPPVFELRQQSTNGSMKVKPVQADGRILFAQRAGRKLRELGYALNSDRYIAPDMNRLADHIGIPGFVEMAWQAEPERFVWVVLGDGTLAAMTYDPEQQVMGWARRVLGGDMEALSACRITDPDGRRDQLWIAAMDGATCRILRMAKLWEFGDDQLSGQFVVDAGLSHSGAPVTELSALDHLEGRTVQVLTDGKVHRELVVAGGKITLDYPASDVVAGLYFPARMMTLPPEVGQSEGVARGKTKRVIALTLHLIEAQGLQVTVQNSDPIKMETRIAADAMDEAVPLYSGLIHIPTVGTYEDLGQVLIERVQPTTATVLAIVPLIEVGEK